MSPLAPKFTYRIGKYPLRKATNMRTPKNRRPRPLFFKPEVTQLEARFAPAALELVSSSYYPDNTSVAYILYRTKSQDLNLESQQSSSLNFDISATSHISSPSGSLFSSSNATESYFTSPDGSATFQNNLNSSTTGTGSIDRCAAKATFVLGDQGQVGFRQEGS
jgi:hypothetical protein